MSEQAVIVEFEYWSDELDDLHELDLRLRALISESGAGEFDGHEIAMDSTHGSLYMYGPDADRLFEVARPVLVEGLKLEAIAILQYGPPDDNTVTKTIVVH